MKEKKLSINYEVATTDFLDISVPRESPVLSKPNRTSVTVNEMDNNTNSSFHKIFIAITLENRIKLDNIIIHSKHTGNKVTMPILIDKVIETLIKYNNEQEIYRYVSEVHNVKQARDKIVISPTSSRKLAEFVLKIKSHGYKISNSGVLSYLIYNYISINI
ncbi:MAG: hypothetical protein RR735_09870 [Bacteroidales bacterium]